MKVTVFGSGYVGLVTGACFAEVGNNVVCVDIDAGKIERLQQGDVPIYEPGLDAIMKRNIDRPSAVHHRCRGGRPRPVPVHRRRNPAGRGRLGRPAIRAGGSRAIGERMKDYRVVINKSTVPVGTADKVRDAVSAVLTQRGAPIEFDVVSNPEFLKEGAAIEDFMKPDRIVVGTDDPRTAELLHALYAPFNRSHDRIV